MKKIKKNRFGVPVFSLTKHAYYELCSLKNSVDKLLAYHCDGAISHDLLKNCLWEINHFTKEFNSSKILKHSVKYPCFPTTHTIYNFARTRHDVTISSDINGNITFDVSDSNSDVFRF